MMLRVDAMFTDGMVLQRDKLVPIWGTGTDGQRVEVVCDDARAEAVVANGQWRVGLPAFTAGGPHEMTVSSGDRSIVFRDVWFGDVWLAGGQSNMEWSLKDATEGPAELPQADFPLIRYYHVPRISYEDGVERRPVWTACTPETAQTFSAVAYFFAKRIQRETDVPIGLIGCNWGGTSASCWVDEQTLESDPDLRVYLDEHQEKMRDITPESYRAAEAEYQANIDAWNVRAGRGLTGAELGDFPWPPPYGEQSFLRPTGLYHAMLRKVVPYALRGFLYYQGESDADGKSDIYDRLLSALIAKWREDWVDASLPFLFVQLPVWDCNGYPDGDGWAVLRESQWKVAQRVPAAWMAAAWEHGDEHDIHPRDKEPIGERLALLALAHVYGRTDVESSGPAFRDVRYAEGAATVAFDHVDGGLEARGNDGVVVGFELAGEDGVFVKADVAEIRGDAVVVRSAQVPAPAAVRYGWANYSEANLMNAVGLPALPFRTR